jgi:hypothetical protein
MAATALLRFTQGLTIGANGQALKGVIGTAVMVLNSDDTDVASWQIDLVYVDPASALVPVTPYAFNDNGSVATATFTPDVRGSYRLVLKVWALPGRVGDPTDTDIRVFAVPEINGFVVPPAQLWPRPLPPLASGEPGARASEFNFGGQADGWAGDGSSDGLLNELIRRVDNLTSATSVQEVLSVLTNGQTAFTLSRPTTSDSTVVLYVNGVKQTYGTDYTVGGSNLTYLGTTPSLVTTDVVEVWFIVGSQLVGNNSTRQETVPVTVNGQTAFTLSEATTSNTTVEMFLNSAKMQYGTDYSVNGFNVTYTGSIPTQTTDVVEFWYVIGPIVSGGGSGTVDFLPDPDTGWYAEKLHSFGMISPKSLIQAGSNLWIVDEGDQYNIPAALIRADVTTRRPQVISRAPYLGERWKSFAFYTSTVGAILSDDASGNRHLFEVTINGNQIFVDTGNPYLLGASTGTDPIPAPWRPYDNEAPLIFAGGYYWTVVSTGVVRIDPTNLSGPYTTIPITNCRWLVYDADGTHYSDSQPRLWVLSNSGIPSVSRIELTGLTVESSVAPFGVTNSTATQILIGGSNLFVIGYDGTTLDHIARITLNPVALSDVAPITGVHGPLSAVYEPSAGKLIVVGIEASLSIDYTISRVDPSTLATEQTVIGNPAYGYLPGPVLVPYPLAALSSTWIPDTTINTVRQVVTSSLASSNLHPFSLEYQEPNYAFDVVYVDMHATYAYSYGSPENPYKRLSDVFQSVFMDSTLILARGNYTTLDAGPLTPPTNMSFVGRGEPSLTTIPALTAAGLNISLQNVTVGNITATSLILDNCVIAPGSAIVATSVQLQNTVVSSTVSFTSTTLYADNTSTYWFDTNGATLTGTRTLISAPAERLRTATGAVDISAAAAPSIGQLLVATSPTTATWQTVATSLQVTVPNSSPQNVDTIVAPPGFKITSTTLSIYNGGQNSADVTLNTDASMAVLAVVITGLNINSFYTCTLGFRCVIWQSGTRANSGSMDCVVDLYITTDGAGVATVVVQTTPLIDTSRLLTALIASTMIVDPSVGGFTISATRPIGVTCITRAKWWVVAFEDIT